MEEADVRQLFSRLFAQLSAEYEIRHPDSVMEMPQSGERIRGRENMHSMQANYPSPPDIQLRRVVGSGDVWVVEMHSDYDGCISHVVMIVELRYGKIVRETRYYADPFDGRSGVRNGWRRWRRPEIFSAPFLDLERTFVMR